MPYRYLEGIATADVAFEARGASLEELFISAADATTNVMVEELGSIRMEQEIELNVESTELDLLLFNFLNELVYYKDAGKLLLRAGRVKIDEMADGWRLKAAAWGEALNPERHDLRADVKAVTLHRLSVEKKTDGWEATVVLDI